MKIAIVADWLTTMGGGEQVVIAMSDLFPQAPIYTSIYNGHFLKLQNRDIRTSWLQKLPKFLRQKHQFLLPLLPHAFSRLDLSEYDVILSSSSAFSKCVTKTENQFHVCYCHTPTRFLFHAREEYLSNYPLPKWMKPVKFFLPKLLDHLTDIDLKAAANVDYFVCNSNFVKDRIDRYYSREAQVINPCVDTTVFKISAIKEDYFFALGRFIPYKKFDLLIKTFADNKLPLKLAGTGPDLEKCKRLAQDLGADNIEFLGFVPDLELPDLYAQAQAFLFPAEEDFGLTPVEAMSSGTPVIAYGVGGATESVTKQTGLLFDEQTPESLQKAIDQFVKQAHLFDKKVIQKRGKQYDNEIFKAKIAKFIDSVASQ